MTACAPDQSRCDRCGTFAGPDGCSNPECRPPEPRIEFVPGEYPRIRYYHDGREWYFYLHRLVGYAHGVIDHPRADDRMIAIDGATGEVRMEPDDRHVHHRDDDGWNNRPENLSGEDPDVHGSITARRNHRNGRW